MKPTSIPDEEPQHYSTLEAAKLLGMAVRSVQMMVDRGELDAWKTPGGHRRITRASLQRWQQANQPAAGGHKPARKTPAPKKPERLPRTGARVLLIEDSTHFQNLVSLLLKQHFPEVQLQVADDGIAGLAMVGQWQPDVLIIDILLPGIDGATLITSLRTHPQFQGSRLIVVTSLNETQRAPYAFALEGVPVIHKPQLVTELPPLLAQCLASAGVRG
jgi:excisionase family DNA binding protein